MNAAEKVHAAAKAGRDWLRLQEQARRAVRPLLARLKREYGMTLRAVAQAIGCHEIWLCYIRNGRKPIGLETLEKLSRLVRRLDRKRDG